MKKIIFPIMLITLLASCSESIEDRAAREAKEYTEKVCPTPFVNDGRTDSTVFDKNTRTYIYYMTLRTRQIMPYSSNRTTRNSMMHKSSH